MSSNRSVLIIYFYSNFAVRMKTPKRWRPYRFANHRSRISSEHFSISKLFIIQEVQLDLEMVFDGIDLQQMDTKWLENRVVFAYIIFGIIFGYFFFEFKYSDETYTYSYLIFLLTLHPSFMIVYIYVI